MVLTTTTTKAVSEPSIAQRLWAQAQPRALQSLYHPFVTALAAGTLARSDFEAFLLQDAYYLLGFAKAFAHAVVKAKDTKHALALIRLMGGIETELSNHSAFLASFGIDVFAVKEATAAPATKQYVDFLLTTAATRDSVAEILAAMTPCMRLYAFIGCNIRSALGGLPTDRHPYSRWIASYGTDEFNCAAKVTEDLLDDVAAAEDVSYATLAPLYNTAMALELCFFEQYFPLARAFAAADALALSIASPLKVLLTVESDASSASYGGATRILTSDDLDALLSLATGTYEIAVTQNSDTTLNVSVQPRVIDGTVSHTDHPLLRAVVASGCAFVETMATTQRFDPTQHSVHCSSALELHTFVRLLAARGRFDAFAYPLRAMSDGRRVPPRVLIIAGSDSGGGAGVQADLKACTNRGVFSSSAITAVTIQNTLGVHGIHGVPVRDIADQITCVLDDIGADVVKTGMLFNEDVIDMVASVLAPRNVPLVVDPVMVATSGDRLLQDAAHASLVRSLFPLARLITPNIPEASVLLGGRVIATLDDMKAAAQDLAAFGSAFVLVKGGHLPDTFDSNTVHDVLFDATAKTFYVLANAKLATRNTHGTGCTLASAIAAELAKAPDDMVGAVTRAVAYLHRVLVKSQGLTLGTGDSGPMLHVV